MLRFSCEKALLQGATFDADIPSLVPREARAIGLDFGQLLERLMELGLAHCGKK